MRPTFLKFFNTSKLGSLEWWFLLNLKGKSLRYNHYKAYMNPTLNRIFFLNQHRMSYSDATECLIQEFERGIAATASVTTPSHNCWCCFSIAIHGLFQPRELRPWLCRPWLLTVTARVSASWQSPLCFIICTSELSDSSVFQHLHSRTMYLLCVSAYASSDCVAAPCFIICIFGLCSSFRVSASVQQRL